MVIEGVRTARRCAPHTLPALTDHQVAPPYDGRMGVMDEAERVEPASVDEWSRWLADHHDSVRGVWLVTGRKDADKLVSYEESVLEALRYGWVDSTQKPVDEKRSMMWFAPRRPGSVWTRINKGRVARLEEAGLMEPAGAAAVASAKESGMWTLMDPVEDLVVPDDLDAAFDVHLGSREHWESFSPSSRKQMLAWIVMAKKPETRAMRVLTTAAKAALGEKSQ